MATKKKASGAKKTVSTRMKDLKAKKKVTGGVAKYSKPTEPPDPD
jgi:hypothetical protein